MTLRRSNLYYQCQLLSNSVISSQIKVNQNYKQDETYKWDSDT